MAYGAALVRGAARDDLREGRILPGIADVSRAGDGGKRRALRGSPLETLRGLGPAWESFHGHALPPRIHCQRAIQVGVDLDARAGVAASGGPGAEVEEAPVELHGVIALDGALELETADAVEVGRRWCGSPGRGGRRRGPSELGDVARDEPVEHALGLREGACLGQLEFDDEAILDGPEEPLDAPCGLGGMGADPAAAEFLEGAADLGRFGPAVELLGQGERATGIAVTDPVAIRGGRGGGAIVADERAEEQGVAVRVLFQAEDPPRTRLVASSIAAWRTSRGPRSSSHRWWLSSIWMRRPAWGMRSRRRRCRGGRRVRGLPIPAARRIRDTVRGETCTSSCATSTSVR